MPSRPRSSPPAEPLQSLSPNIAAAFRRIVSSVSDAVNSPPSVATPSTRQASRAHALRRSTREGSAADVATLPARVHLVRVSRILSRASTTAHGHLVATDQPTDHTDRAGDDHAGDGLPDAEATSPRRSDSTLDNAASPVAFARHPRFGSRKSPRRGPGRRCRVPGLHIV